MDGARGMLIRSISCLSSTPVASMSSRLPRGTIAAIVVGVSVVVIASVIFLVFYCRRRRRESRRKQSFLVNPRLYRRRFSSLLTRAHPPSDNEKARQTDRVDPSQDFDVLDISAAKDDDSDEEDEDREEDWDEGEPISWIELEAEVTSNGVVVELEVDMGPAHSFSFPRVEFVAV